MVVSGDLTQSLGAPVERGTVLYEVAPMSAFRVILKVDERDMADVAAGQRGNILLSAFPQAYQELYPVNQTADGQPRQRSVGGGGKGRLEQPRG